MSPLPLFITPIYAVIFTIMLIWLTLRVIKYRREHRVLYYDGGVNVLTSAIRAHGNFVEYIPHLLVLMMIAELNHAPVWGLHLMGAILLIGRFLHVYGLTRASLRYRVYGMSGTFIALLVGIILLISTFFAG